MAYRLISLSLALALLATILVAFFSPILFVYAQETPTPPSQEDPAPANPQPSNPPQSQPASTAQNQTTQPNTGGGNGFVPLTSLPGVNEVSSSDGIASFLNQLYRISVGAAAVLAVLQIIRGGLMYMTEESISEKKEARNLITMAILGLVLVLSPAIVFRVIDPRILNLDLDLSSIQPATGTGTGQGQGQQGEGAAGGDQGNNDGADGADGDGGEGEASDETGEEDPQPPEGDEGGTVDAENQRVEVLATARAWAFVTWARNQEPVCSYIEVDDRYQSETSCTNVHPKGVGERVGPYTVLVACDQVPANGRFLLTVPAPACNSTYVRPVTE